MRSERRESVVDVGPPIVELPDPPRDGRVVELPDRFATRPDTRPSGGSVTERRNDLLPAGADWRFEPDWDGLGVTVRLGPGKDRLVSDRGRGFDRFFPEVVETVAAMPADGIVLVGSLVVVGRAGMDFAAVRQRLHPSPARVRALAATTPATLVLTDIVVDGSGDLRDMPIVDRRRRLERLADALDVTVPLPNLRHIAPGLPVLLTPQTFDRSVARAWLLDLDAVGRDGVVARHADGRRRERVLHTRTASCVVTGFKPSGSAGQGVVRLGMYEHGRLVDVGRTVTIRRAPARRAVVEALMTFAHEESNTTGTGSGWVDVPPLLVCEVQFDRLRGKAFRHAVPIVRWLLDRDPSTCTVDQIAP